MHAHRKSVSTNHIRDIVNTIGHMHSGKCICMPTHPIKTVLLKDMKEYKQLQATYAVCHISNI